MEIKQTDQLDNIYQDAREIRRHVFVGEQGINEADEFDGTDSDAIHFVAYQGGQPVATARTTVTADGVHIQRVATEKEYRHKGYAKQLLTTILQSPMFQDTPRFYLGAQATAIGFYETLGFKQYGQPFMEVGIKHVNMEKLVTS
ncbi:GNAT family N-acetyltransferase [Lentilactobacillus kefiri]|uniref:N-acetyltransferase GCN5 n=3 Tax=Lactobacillales TaxID=186826 RepID=A0A8E1RJH2_LENKE|nr:GNAT family N-acetyltransferase [Lentilactobacillus kefiri]KRL70396.1 N-acetyltransferase GCN5 [Lentilactobacillus parakefiri DSM 10551]KRM53031.1 N-acetyltransferase GCN5 [Lentilactobacillus kefiri DSM 20587 = JCM 5818]MCJ2161874.1 GNAT family N-acetyltransferase [Lentilactobacillus kefiri]MCP9369263.1 GNAT family N-acetyltransferase [Lentilactobacillus kefiri]MDH5108606.1 GNAT family N-acetyltransferase [Lentilactobacillus kefiri]